MKRNNFAIIFGNAIICSCLGLFPTPDGTCDERANWVYNSILAEIGDSPWRPPQVPMEEQQPGEALKAELELQGFDPQKDRVDELMRRGRRGDLLAIAKLQDYLFENQATEHRFNILEITAKHGINEVACYYAALIEDGGSNDLRMEVIEDAIELLMSESESGGVRQSLALYRLFGDLNSNGVHSRFGKNTHLCEIFIQRAYSAMKKEEFLDFLKIERLRLGWVSRLDSNIVPHVSKDWQPK